MAARKKAITRRRRLEVDDVLVVKKSRLRTAISGTVVGNFMEWFDFGIYGYLAVTLTNHRVLQRMQLSIIANDY